MPLESFATPPDAPVLAAWSPPPVRIGSLLGRTFGVWWSNLLRFAAFTVLLAIPIVLVVVAFLGVGVFAGAPREESNRVLMVVILVPLVLLVVLAQMGGLTYGGVQHLAGRKASIGGMLSAGLGRLPALLGLATLLVIAFLIVAMLMGIVGFVVGRLLSSLAFLAFLLFWAVRLSVSVPCIVVERAGPFRATERSLELTRGHRGKIFVAVLVLYLLQAGINLAAQRLGQLSFVGWLISLVVQLLVMSLTGVFPAVAYNDLRISREGGSTEDLARVFE